MQNFAADRPTRRPDVEMEVLPDGSALLFDPQTDKGHVLMAFAGFVWDMCDGTMSSAAMSAEITLILPATRDIAQTVQALLTEFTELGLLEMGEADGGT